jgi:predicted ATPase
MMKIIRDDFYILSGGPGAGKTAVIEVLRARGYRCVEEVARKILKQQMKFDGDAVDWKDQAAFREVMLSWSIADFESVDERVRPVFFDRGIPELTAYANPPGVEAPAHLQRAAALFRYNPIVFVAPPWQEIYCTDAERKQSFEEAIDVWRRVTPCYEKCGYVPIELPRVAPEKRADFILERIAERRRARD